MEIMQQYYDRLEDGIFNRIKSISDSYDKQKDKKLILDAFNLAVHHHLNDKRESGEPYIVHPLGTAEILLGLNADSTTIASALLHDILEDTKCSKEELERICNKDVAKIVDGVTKFSELRGKSREERDAASIRKMLWASSNDIRVIMVKLADKLHNMRTIQYLDRDRQISVSKSVLNIYAPMAHRLGIERIKSELQESAFKTLMPKTYNKIRKLVERNHSNRELKVSDIKNFINKKLEENNIKAVITGRPKSYYSIYQKMLKKNLKFSEVFDIIGLRIKTETVKNCYSILGIIHNIYTPIPKQIKDYIALPKINMYQSVHTTVIDNTGQIIEFQIRTYEMDSLAEEGIAAHWVYKQSGSDKIFDKKITWLKEIIEAQKDTDNLYDFLENLKLDLFQKQIFTFTPKGKVIELPKGSTVIDFAYTLHTNLGDNCSSARINNKFASIRTELNNGDIVEIITNKNQHPRRDWIPYAKTRKARSKIKHFIRLEQKLPVFRKPQFEESPYITKKSLFIVNGVKKAKIRLSKCCNPLPMNKILGLAAKSGVTNIHIKDCKEINKIKKTSKKFVKVSWLEDIEQAVEIKVLVKDRVGMFADIFNTVASLGINVIKAGAKTLSNNNAECSFTIHVNNKIELINIINSINKVKDVLRINLSVI